MRIQQTGLYSLLAAILFAAMAPTARAAQDGPFTHEDTGTSITITRYTASSTVVTIPDTIAGKPVTIIGNNAFSGHARLTSIILGNGVTELGSFAFVGCIGLTNINIPTNMTTIGDWAFRSAGLTSVTIPKSVTSIGEGAFGYCAGLRNIIVDVLNRAYVSTDGVLFNQNQTMLVQYPAGKPGAFTIPDSVTLIRGRAFAGCAKLTSVIISNSVTKIGQNAFQGCTGLTSVILGNGVTEIGSGAFAGCIGLTSITIPSNIITIGGEAFIGAGLTRVTIPNSVTSIGGAPFGYCGALTNIAVDPLNPSYSSVEGVLFNKDKTVLIQYPGGKIGSHYIIPETVNSVGDLAFVGCIGLSGVTIPNSVISIGFYAFQESGLTRVTIPDSVTKIEGAAFRNCYGLTSVTIGNGVTTIMGEAFSDCPRLTSVTIGNSVTYIDPSAFAACHGLRSVYSLGNAANEVGQFAASDRATVFYRAGTTGWGSDFGGRPTMLWVATDDLDQDGLSNEKEMLWGTDPLRADGIADFMSASSAEKAGYRLRLSVLVNIPDGIATAMALAGNYLYVSTADPEGRAEYVPGIHVFEVADPNNPIWKATVRGSQHFGAYGAPLVVEGNVLYSFNQEKVSLIDVTDPKSPRLVLQWSPAPGIQIQRIAAKGNFLYVLDEFTLTVLNVTNPALPVVVGKWRNDLPNNYGPMEVSGSHAFVPEGGILRIVDVSNPAAPTLVKSYTQEPESTPIGPMAFKNGFAFIVTRYDTSDWRIDVLDITNPAEPLLVASLPYPYLAGTASMNLVNDRLYIHRHESLMPGEHDFLGVVDIRDPSRPILVGEFGSRNYSTPSFHSMAANDESIFLRSGSTILVYGSQIFPSLGVTSTDHQIELNWPNIDPEFQLQQKDRINTESPWTNVLSPPNFRDGQNYLAIPEENGANLFRLMKQ